MSTCSVPGCTSPAYAIPYLFDIYEHGEIFLQQDKTCPFICQAHLAENERKAEGIRKPRGTVKYPYTNQKGARGFTVYGPTVEQEQRKRDAQQARDEAEGSGE
jgi:hypothetical protein